MCVDPISMIAIGASVASAAVGAVGAVQQGNAASVGAVQQAQQFQVNATLADRAAEDARKRGSIEEQDHRRKTAALMGRQTAAMAANGVDLSSGSPLDILADTRQMGEWDALTIRGNAEREAKGYEAQGANFRSDAELSRMRASSAKTAGLIGAAGAVVGGIGQVADKWYKMGSPSTGKIV